MVIIRQKKGSPGREENVLLVLSYITMYPYSLQSGPTLRSAGERCIGDSGRVLQDCSASGFWKSLEGKGNLTVRGLLSLCPRLPQ